LTVAVFRFAGFLTVLFFAGDFLAFELLADTRVAPAGLVTDLAARLVAIGKRLNHCHSGMRLLAQARNER
jgi:hypothetical protein